MALVGTHHQHGDVADPLVSGRRRGGRGGGVDGGGRQLGSGGGGVEGDPFDGVPCHVGTHALPSEEQHDEAHDGADADEDLGSSGHGLPAGAATGRLRAERRNDRLGGPFPQWSAQRHRCDAAHGYDEQRWREHIAECIHAGCRGTPPRDRHNAQRYTS